MMNIVIVGAGQAGAAVARAARTLLPQARIRLLGDEAEPPYERPPLSKQVLAEAGCGLPALLAQPAEAGIEWLPSTPVAAIDRGERQAVLVDGRRLDYDHLVIATGGRARLPDIPGIRLPEVHTLRSWQDAMQLRQRLASIQNLLVLGGGWIGLEVAAAARRRGIRVTLIEGAARLCQRSVPPVISRYLWEQHTAHGVDVQLDGRLDALRPGPEGGLLADTHRGTERFDAVLVGVGLQPATGLAEACGLNVADGIVVDEAGLTSDPSIHACGDVANQPCPWPGADVRGRIRLESWANAQQQGGRVARSLAGLPMEPADPPWFWSDQYDWSLQVLGLPDPQADWVRRERAEDGTFCLFQQDARGLLRAVISVGMARELKLGKRWMKAGICPSPEQLVDPAFRLDRFRGEVPVALA